MEKFTTQTREEIEREMQSIQQRGENGQFRDRADENRYWALVEARKAVKA